MEVDDPSQYGVVVMKEGLPYRVVEKPKEFVSDLINIGMYKFTPEIFEAIEWTEIRSFVSRSHNSGPIQSS